MKLKQSPDDFQVEERTYLVPSDHGDFALYRLEKTDWTTPDALALLRRRWHIEPRRMSCGGLKDRHARTVQHLTIFHGPRRNLSQQGVKVTYLGKTAGPFTSEQVRANRFEIVVRQLPSERAERVVRTLEDLRKDGVPNYFDDQRFGSVTAGGDFIARLMVAGRFEEALRLALTGAYEYDRAAQKREKATLREHWGDWPACQQNLGRGDARGPLEHLVHNPADFRGALERLRPEMRSLYMAAYQSDVWNRTLALFLQRLAPERMLTIPLRRGGFPFHHGLEESQQRTLAGLPLPLASARLKLPANDPRGELIRAVLAEDGLTLEQMKVRGSRDLFFSRGERAALCLPRELSGKIDEDEHHPGSKKLTLIFELSRGSYATLVVKRLQADATVPA
jgi:tRNA pseudouridine13 synthase